MAKKKDEKDVLVVRDEKTGEISVVAGLNADGSPKRIPAKAENSQSFLQFDRHGDVLDNFFRNFFRQCKEPSRFGFYRVAAEQADNLLEVMKELLKNPEAYSELLAPHKVDTSGYEQEVQKVQEEQQQQREEEQQPDQENKENQEEPKNQEEMEQKQEQNQEAPQQTQGRQGYQPIDENRINWQELEERWGVKRDELEKSGDLQKMLNYGKSDLVKVTPNFGGEAFELDARLSFRKDGEGNVSLVPHFIRKEQKLEEYKDGQYGEADGGTGEQAPDRPGLCPEGVRHRQTRTDVHGPDRPAEPVEQQLPQDAGRGGEDGHEGAAGHHFGRAGRGGEQRRHHLPDRGYTQQ